MRDTSRISRSLLIRLTRQWVKAAQSRPARTSRAASGELVSASTATSNNAAGSVAGRSLTSPPAALGSRRLVRPVTALAASARGRTTCDVIACTADRHCTRSSGRPLHRGYYAQNRRWRRAADTLVRCTGRRRPLRIGVLFRIERLILSGQVIQPGLALLLGHPVRAGDDRLPVRRLARHWITGRRGLVPPGVRWGRLWGHAPHPFGIMILNLTFRNR